jgi:hypothetical protein
MEDLEKLGFAAQKGKVSLPALELCVSGSIHNGASHMGSMVRTRGLPEWMQCCSNDSKAVLSVDAFEHKLLPKTQALSAIPCTWQQVCHMGCGAVAEGRARATTCLPAIQVLVNCLVKLGRAEMQGAAKFTILP